MAIDAITIEPALSQWRALADARPVGTLFGRSLQEWRELTRRELSLPVDRPIIGTGHQPMLWHPGILAKYAAIDAIVRAAPMRTSGLNVIVDQDVVDFASFDVPIRRGDGSLSSRRIGMEQPTKADVPVGWLPAFVPRDATVDPVEGVPELQQGVTWIRSALEANKTHPSAAAQVAHAQSILMGVCANVDSMPTIKASDLMQTTIARGLLRATLDDPHRCARAYNEAIASQPDARMTPLAIRDDYVELPLWRLREDATRVRAYDADVEQALEGEMTRFGGGGLMADVPDSRTILVLLPRALFMTAIIRIALCDLFVHGRGGAVYDHSMERWIRAWLGIEVSPMAVASADVRLPLMPEEDLERVRSGGLASVRSRARRLMHDPETATDVSNPAPGLAKQAMLREIGALPRRSRERRAAFFAMHERLEGMRREQSAAIEAARTASEHLERLTNDAVTAMRRDWAFALHSKKTLMEFVERIRAQLK